MKIFDSHFHLFSLEIIENVSRKQEMCKQLRLRTHGARDRRDTEGLEGSMKTAGAEAGLVLPTAGTANMARVNSIFIEKVANTDFLHTPGTLHPKNPDNGAELEKLKHHGVKGIKMCSFSQGFELDGPAALAMFKQIQDFNRNGGHHFFIVLDTLYSAAR